MIRRRFSMFACGVFTIVFALLAGSWAPEAQAYLDPGTGSLVVQIFIGAVAAAGTAVSLYWHRFKKLLTSWRNPGKSRAAPNGGDENGESGSI